MSSACGGSFMLSFPSSGGFPFVLFEDAGIVSSTLNTAVRDNVFGTGSYSGS